MEPRIVGGRIVQRNAYPWMIGLRAFWGPIRCGGVLITPRHALTAAHCLPTPTLLPWVLRVVLLGHTHYDGVEIPITLISIHPNYGQKAKYDSDIAVMTLTYELRSSDKVRPICIGSYTPPIGSKCVVLGWGRTRYNYLLSGALRETNVSLLPTERCQGYGKDFTDSMLCAAGRGKDACVGDSGGPLVVDVGGAWVVVGVVAYGRGCGIYLYPGAYTNLVPLKRWIESVLF